MTKINRTSVEYNSKTDLDEKQRKVYTMFPTDSFLGNPNNVEHFIAWVTFFRRNLHRFAIDYLGLNLHLYQVIWLYLMGICQFFVVVASRASAKSWMIAVYACCKCILYPNYMVVLASSTKGQSKLLISDKIEKELMGRSPRLRKEIKKIVSNQTEMMVYFKNNSTIRVVTANEGARGNRSNCVVREECRQLKRYIDESVLSPFQILRQPTYMTNPEYADIEDLKEEATDIYISSSWFDNGSEDSWMWNIVDNTFDDMMKGNPSCLLAFDESVALRHNIKSQRYYQTEKKKQDPITWRLEFMNERLKENRASFFTYDMLRQNQICKQPFYPRTIFDYKSGRKNPYSIPKMPGEIRIVGCDMAFVENSNNDNSVFTCMRLLPESKSRTSESGNDVEFDNAYRRVIPYIEHMQGGEIKKQAVRIRELYDDFGADYICLDTRNSGISIYDFLARTLYDEARNIEYKALTCMNDEGLANRIKVEGAEPRIFAINATQKLNSDIALDFRRRLLEHQIDFLVSFETASEEILPDIKEYMAAADGDEAIFYETPFLETQALFAEATELTYEKKAETGVIVLRELAGNRKDRYTSASYASWLGSLLERDLLSDSNEYEACVFIN